MASMATLSAANKLATTRVSLEGSSLAATKLTVKPTPLTIRFKTFGTTLAVATKYGDKKQRLSRVCCLKDATSTPSTKVKVIEMPQYSMPVVRVYEDGTVERLIPDFHVDASMDPATKVVSKDVIYSNRKPNPDDPDDLRSRSVRLYIPESALTENKKLPVLIYTHGGNFCIGSAFSPMYHGYLNTLVSRANVIAVSINYRRAPEVPVPNAHDDAWEAANWVASHAKGNGAEDWLNRHADYQRVFFNGDSAGGNITHRIGVNIGVNGLEGINVAGIVLSHPSFWGKDSVPGENIDALTRRQREEMWQFTYPSAKDCDDPVINPVKDPNLERVGCPRMLVFVAGNDLLRSRGLHYVEKLKESGWKGEVDVVEHPGEEHTFHLFNGTSEHALDMLEKIVAFINK